MAANFKLFSLFTTTTSILSFILLFVFSLTEASHVGFSVDLIHRDSPLSPFYNPSETHSDRLHNAFLRSISRIHHFINPTSSPSNTKAIQSKIIPSSGEFLMKISIGTPPKTILGVADTGSDLTWTQCKPCENCFNQTAPLFNPRQSSTYRDLSCGSRPCNALGKPSCGFNTTTNCEYSYSYGDQSFTYGNLAVETVTIGSTSGRPISLPKIVFGCGHNNGGTFDESASGIIGLGGGSLSLVSQLGKCIHGKFSYCFVPPFTKSNTTSKIIFGSGSVLSSSGAVSTPLVAKEPDTFYYLTLEAISVGNQRLAYKGSSKAAATNEKGNIIIDSGTTLTFLPPEFYTDLESALVKALDVERVSDPKGLLSLCFRAESDIDVPIITAHFTGAEVKLKPLNTFVRVEDDVVCFTMVPSESLAIFGNLSQLNFLVAYNLVNKTVSFMPTDCTKH